MQAAAAFTVRLFLDEPVIRSPAPAGFSVSASKKSANDDGLLAAGTSAPPQGLFASAADAFDCSQSTKRLAGDINNLGHDDLCAGCLCQVTGRRATADPSRHYRA